MASRLLTEFTVNMITDKIKADIAAALAEVRTDRNDPIVSTAPPKKYFIYDHAKGYDCPYVYVICNTHKMNNAERGANHLNTTAIVHVSVVVEDRVKDLLVIKSWRYQAALHKILHETELTSSDNLVTLKIKVSEMGFSPEYSGLEDKSASGSVFRKEVVLSCEVEHYENL